MRARSSKTKHLDDAVPWSIEATYRPVMLTSREVYAANENYQGIAPSSRDTARAASIT